MCPLPNWLNIISLTSVVLIIALIKEMFHRSVFWPYVLIRVCDLFEDAAASKLF